MSEGHHTIPKSILLKVFGSLIVLTVITYAVAQVDLGPLNIPVAIAIASVKAGLVVMFFMALKYDNPVNTLTFSVGVIFVVIFITFTLFDTAFRGDMENVSSRTIEQIQREEEELQQRQEALSPEQLRVTPADYGSSETSGASDGGSADDGASNGSDPAGDSAGDNTSGSDGSPTP